MATQVEVSSVLGSLAGLSELASEAKLQHTFASSLSSASSRPSQLPSSLSPLLLEESNAFGNPLRPASATLAASRPRLTPKPFSRETSTDTFAMVKPPVPALKAGNVAPKPSTFAKTFDDVAAAKGSTGNVPPLLDQKSIETKSPSELVANMPFYSSPQTNTVILFETGSAEKTRLKLTSGQNIVASSTTSSTLQAREGQPPSSTPEGSYRRSEGASIQRQLSLSSESRPASCNPRKSLERKSTFTEEKADEAESQCGSVLCFASEGRTRSKQRPVSAIFLESLRDQKQGGPDVPDEKALPEKSWVRKPRPLSMDLTAKFESKDFSVQRKSGPAEIRERSLDTEVDCSRPSEMAALGRADHPKSKLKAAVPTADSPGDSRSLIETPSPSQPAPSCWSAPKSLGQASAKDRKYLWEVRLRSQDEPDERDVTVGVTPGKSKEPPPSKGVQERGAQHPKDTGTVSSADASDAEKKNFRGGSIKRPIHPLGASSSSTAPATAEPPPPESPGTESRMMNVQQRIKELTAESADAKPGDLRRSFRSRPLSADLTKLFSSPVTGGEAKLERQAELSRKLASEVQGIQENKADLLHGADSREARPVGPPGKPRQLARVLPTDGPLERDASFARERPGAALKDGGSASFAHHDLKTHSAPPLENECLKTVRATMFEHNVQRHTVTADRLGVEVAFQLVAEHTGGPLTHRREPGMEQAPETPVASKKVPSKPVEAPLDGVKYGGAKLLSVDKVSSAAPWGKRAPQESWEKPPQSHAEDSLMYQRIEPRYEILQTVGETAQSVAVAAVPEDKAVTLRSRKVSKERRKTEGSLADASWPRGLDLEGAGWKEEAFAPKTSEVGLALKERAASCGQHVCHELDASQAGQQHVTARASSFANRHKDSGATDATVSRLPVEVGQECLPGKTEGPNLSKGFPGGWRAMLGRSDGCKARASIGQSAAPASPGEHSTPTPVCGISQRQKLSSKVPACPSPEQEGSKVFGLRKYLAAPSAQEEWAVSGRRAEAGRFQPLDVEEQAGRSGRHSLAPKASDRWRRKTLPHDAASFEEVGALAQESAKALSRRDSWKRHNGSVAKKSLQVSGSGAEPGGESSTSPGSPDGSRKNPPSPLEPKATYFAVTYQIPGENEKSISGKAFEPLRSREAPPSLAENAALTPISGASGRSHPAPHQHSKMFSDAQGSLDRHLGKSWGLGETSDLAKKGTSQYPPAVVRGENRRSLERRPEEAKEGGAGSDPLQAEPKSPPYLRHLHQERARSGPAVASLGVAKERGAVSYQSRVLDLDTLMAEYEAGAKKASVVQDKREGGSLSEDCTLLPREKVASKRISADKTPASYNWSDPRGECAGQGLHGMEFSGSKRESRELSSLKGDREAKFSPPHWGRPATERPKYLPGDPIGTRKKTFITDEEEGESLMLRRRGATFSSDVVVQVPKLARMDMEPEAATLPRPSQALPDRASWKGGSPKQPRSVFWGEDQHAAAHARGASNRKGSAHGSSSEADSSAVENRAGRIGSAPGLANAPPELRRSYSEKVRQARGRGSFPLAPEASERRDLPRARKSFPPESADGQLNKRSAPQQDASSPKEKKDLEWTKQDQESLAGRSSPYLPIQRRSRSFYKERTADRWAADQLKQCCGRPAPKARDTDTLVPEADSQYGTWSDQRHSGDSFAPESPSSDGNVPSARKQPPSSRLSSFSSQTDAASAADQHDSSRGQRSSSLDVDSADDTEAPALVSLDFSFLDQTPVLDSSALKTRVQLSKRRRQHRAPISHSLRKSPGGEMEQRLSVAEEGDSAWMFKDSTEVKPAEREASEEEEPRPAERSPVSQPQRLPVFPGMDHSALKAQLRKRQETEGSADASPAQLSKSPKSSLQARAVGGPEKEERSEEASPQWLKELRSKKRQSQYENQV